MISFFVSFLSRICALDLFGYLMVFLFVGGCFRLVWRLVTPGGGKAA